MVKALPLMVLAAGVVCLGGVAVRANDLTIATEDYPPFNFPMGRSVGGLSTDILRKALDRAQIAATITLYPWLRAYGSAQDDANACVYSTTRTELRENLFKWVGPISHNNWVLFARADNPAVVTSLDDVRGAVIGGYQGDATALYLRGKGLTVDTAPSDRLNPRKLLNGRIDYWATGQWSGGVIAVEEGARGLKVALVIKDVPLYLACNKAVSDSLIDRLNRAVQSLRDEGVIARLDQDYRREFTSPDTGR